jgi:1-deoxy-D-xylulose-5-phosphate reductoisomerase
MKLKEDKNINIFPVDSEHSALWQCLIGENRSTIKKLILTASGGPFRKLSKEKFNDITKEDALKHPNWDMGNKISIDSATMMNKGFELIEAYWLFKIPVNQIQIVVHPQSIIHSMVEFIDGSIKAQLSEPDMRIPIQFALSYPNRYEIKDIDFSIEKFSKLNFEEVDLDKFKCVKLAYNALQSENSFLTVLNVANDLLVSLFLQDKITFNMIPEYIERAMDKHHPINNPNISEIKKLTKWTKSFVERNVSI